MTADRVALLLLIVVGVIGFVVLAIFDQLGAAAMLLTGIPALGVVLIGKQVADVKDHLSNGAFVDKVRQGVELGLDGYLERGIVEEPYRPPPHRKDP